MILTKTRILLLLLQIFILVSLFLITAQSLAHGSGSNSKLEKTVSGGVFGLDVKWVGHDNYYHPFHARRLLNAHPLSVELRARGGGGRGGGGGRSGGSGGGRSGGSGGGRSGGRGGSRGIGMGYGQYGQYRGHNGHRERASKANTPSMFFMQHSICSFFSFIFLVFFPI